ncbi:MAG: DUF3343 domain-containing protein [Spirochaetaceae bacterium]|nr:DUF3343 domain-containing protein [Spirochaetaceae bacterium]
MAEERSASKAESLLCFESASQAVMAEQALLENAFDVRIMPKPSAIGAGCGFCLRFSPDDLEKAVAFLSERGIIAGETYLMKEADGKMTYCKENGTLPENAPGKTLGELSDTTSRDKHDLQ